MPRRQVAPRAPQSADGRAQASGRTGSTRPAVRIEQARHPVAARSHEQSAADPEAGQPAGTRGGSRRGREPDADAAQAERSRALLRPVVARLARRRGRRWAAVRRGQSLAARPAPDDHDRRPRADVLRRRAARPLGPGPRPRAPPAGADPLRTHAQTTHAPRQARPRRADPRRRSPERRGRGIPARHCSRPGARDEKGANRITRTAPPRRRGRARRPDRHLGRALRTADRVRADAERDHRRRRRADEDRARVRRDLPRHPRPASTRDLRADRSDSRRGGARRGPSPGADRVRPRPPTRT